MSVMLKALDEADACRGAILHVWNNGSRLKRSKEVTAFCISIPFSDEAFGQFCLARDDFGQLIGHSAQQAIKRTDRVYVDPRDRISKPSYRSRLENYPDVVMRPEIKNSVSQIEKIASDLAIAPRLSTLSFTFLRPADLFEKRWPGYVPCPVAGDFKYRDEKLMLNVFFRSCDVLNFLYNDIIYLRKLQDEVLSAAKSVRGSKIPHLSEIGELNLFLSRAFLQTTEIKANFRGRDLVDVAADFLGKLTCDRRMASVSNDFSSIDAV